MTADDIYDFFKDDGDLLLYFDPLSTAANNKQASIEIYNKIVEYQNEYKCSFVNLNIGYIFYAKEKGWFKRNMLVSFCLRPEYRGSVNASRFWSEIKHALGKHFKCYLYTKNKRAINFLLKGGMRIKMSNDLITLLSI